MCTLMQSNRVEVYWIYIMCLACNYKDDLFCFFYCEIKFPLMCFGRLLHFTKWGFFLMVYIGYEIN